MAIKVNNPKADALTREFASLAGVGITDAIVVGVEEAYARRREVETPLQTAERIRSKYGVSLSPEGRTPLPKSVFDELCGDRL